MLSVLPSPGAWVGFGWVGFRFVFYLSLLVVVGLLVCFGFVIKVVKPQGEIDHLHETYVILLIEHICNKDWSKLNGINSC